MAIICVGDSLTFGNVGYSYIHFLDKKFQTINKGKNGDTVRGAHKRLKKFIDKPGFTSNLYILGIGTNDILLPYLKTVSPFWWLQMSLRTKIMGCIVDDTVFYQEYDELLHFLSQKNKQVIIFGMPFINLKDFPHDILLKRNKMIEELAKKYRFPYLDTYQLQKNQIAADCRTYTWKGSYPIRVLDATIMTLFPASKDWFAKQRGLTTSVDGAHFNSATASLLAKEIEKRIEEIGN